MNGKSLCCYYELYKNKDHTTTHSSTYQGKKIILLYKINTMVMATNTFLSLSYTPSGQIKQPTTFIDALKKKQQNTIS